MTKQKFNAYQIAAKTVYGGGDYANIKTMAETNLETSGDGLFGFIMRELRDDGGPMDLALALQRMRSAQSDIEAVIAEIQKVPAPQA